jgi:hypothetical protein
MGYWGFYRMDNDTPYRESVTRREVRDDIDPNFQATV